MPPETRKSAYLQKWGTTPHVLTMFGLLVRSLTRIMIPSFNGTKVPLIKHVLPPLKKA
jgi:hypothetical protein